ncbi:unnamed protein product [Phytophthora lilii]|uniref:Unnamed protein product n=1 Tax=Phytophthora lilii TaxID=2077276 RepID=A0A9W6XAW6_9STRA|nr:unnamed protein product [Phytophthora lilii]
MASRGLPRASVVLLAATLTATSSAIDFSGQNDVTQTAGTVAPSGETPSTFASSGANGFGNFDSPTQWSASSGNNVPTTAPTVASGGSGGWSPPTVTNPPSVLTPTSGSGGQGWSQPSTTDSPTVWAQTSGQSSGSQGWTTTDAPSVFTPTSGQASGTGDQGWSPPTSSMAGAPSSVDSSGYDDGTLGVDCSGSSEAPAGSALDDGTLGVDCSGSSEGDWSPGPGEFSLECSGLDEDFNPGNDVSLECSGSDEEEPSFSTSTAGSSNTTPTTTTAPASSSGTGDQGWAQPATSTANSSNTATSAGSGGYKEPSPTILMASSSISSGPSDQTAQTSSVASSSDTAQSTASSSNTEQSSNTASSTTQEGSDTTQQTSSGEHASFGDVTSKSGECVIGNPDKYISTADVDWVWEHRMGENVTNNKNWIFDHIVANKGSLNYCVRWDSSSKLSKTVASKFQAMLERQYAAWNRWLIGYGCWPYNEIEINMVGFAVKDATLLDWTDDLLGTIYAGDLDAEGIPQCPQTCYKFYDNAPKTWSDTSGCKGKPFDLSLWPKQGLEGGFGYDWGQEVNLENMLQTIDEEQLTIVAHEIGHGFGLPDFFEEADKPNKDFPVAIMMAGSSMTITDSDGWMLRRAYEHVRSRYNFK